jgi:iron complex transport system ATP-binding protein
MLTAEAVTVNYDGHSALQDVSLAVGPSSMLVLLGANGAGKTTLIKALNGTVEPSAGRVLLDSKPLTAYPRREIARRIAVVAQENETKFPVSVLEFVLAGRFAHGGAFGWETPEDIDVAKNALGECDLSQMEERYMNELSGGERQRVVLARSLASGSKILLLDEPTANIDLAHQGSIFRLIKARCVERGHSAVVITHDLNLASEFADEAVLLKGKKVFAKGPPREVLTAENLRDVFSVNVLLDDNPASGKIRVTTVY